MRSRVVGFGGAAGSGKTTAAEMLVRIAQPQSHEHIEFSEPILEVAGAWLEIVENPVAKASQKNALVEAFGDIVPEDASLVSSELSPLDDEYAAKIFSAEIDKTISQETKDIHRPLLEWLGHSAIHLVSPMVWGDIVHGKIHYAIDKDTDLVTVGGVRSVADQEVIKRNNGIAVRLRRGVASQLSTESQLNQWQADFTVENNGTLHDLRESMGDVWRELNGTS